jgi:hypothetical protein
MRIIYAILGEFSEFMTMARYLECGVLPEVLFLVFPFRMRYFKPKSAILARKWGQSGEPNFRLIA